MCILSKMAQPSLLFVWIFCALCAAQHRRTASSVRCHRTTKEKELCIMNLLCICDASLKASSAMEMDFGG
jgi:hypothetical protein